MSRVLIISTDIVGARMAGPGIRAFELARALAGQHQVTLAVPGGSDIADPRIEVATYAYGQPDALTPLLARADVVVGQGFVFEGHPELLASQLPLAIDLYDPLILESLDLLRASDRASAEARAADYLRLTNRQLARGDFFFCATAGQRDYWLGALTAAGRLTPELAASADRELRSLIDLVPSGIAAAPPARGAPVLRGAHPAIGPDDLLLIWAGGLWDWFDPLVLVRAVARLHERCPRLRLVFLAGARPNPHGEPIRTRNAAAVAALADELGVLGSHVILVESWVPYEERGRFLAEADIGVSAHLPGIETRFAFRTRLLDYIWARLPLIASAGDSLSEQITACGGGLLVPPGDVDGWAAAISQLYHDPAERARMRAAIDRLAAEFTWAHVARPLAAFCAAPRRAGRPLAAEPGHAALATARASADAAGAYARRLEGELAARDAQIASLRDLLHRIENGKVMRILRAITRRSSPKVRSPHE